MGESEAVPFITRPHTVPFESWDSGAGPGVSWQTLISGDRTPTNELSAGVCYVEVGGELSRHHHAQAEVYHFIAGSGRVTVNGELETRRDAREKVLGNRSPGHPALPEIAMREPA